MTPLKKDYNIFMGGLARSLKGIKLDESLSVKDSLRTNIMDSGNVTALSWADDKEENLIVACGTKESQSVRIFNTESCLETDSYECLVGEGNVVGVCHQQNTILAARQSGHVINPKLEEESCLVVDAGPDLRRMRQSNADKCIIATGGLENPLKLFNTELKRQTFVAKNVKNDSLQLRVPVWVSDIGFIPDSSKVVTASKYGHVRLYDTQAQRRPVVSVQVKQEALGSLAVHPSNMQVIVGSGKGIMNLVDLRNGGKILNSYKGAAGSITAIAINKTGSHVVSVSLDRYLRIHDLNTKKLLKQIYLSTRSTCVLIRSDFATTWTEDRT